MEPSIKRMIYEEALKLKRLSIPRVSQPYQFGASEAGECPRVIYLRRTGRKSEEKFKSEEDEARIEMLLNDGAGIHQERITDYIKQSPGVHITNAEEGRVLFCEYKDVPFIITGHTDGVLFFTKGKERWILEVKGVSTNNIAPFHKLRLFDEDIDSLKLVYPKAIPQSRMYRRLYTCKDYPIVGSIVLIKNKNDSGLFEFHFPADEKIEDRIIEKFGKIAYALKHETDTPICDYMKKDYATKYCIYPDECGVGR